MLLINSADTDIDPPSYPGTRLMPYVASTSTTIQCAKEVKPWNP